MIEENARRIKYLCNIAVYVNGIDEDNDETCTVRCCRTCLHKYVRNACSIEVAQRASQRAGLLTASLLVDELRDGTKRAKVEHLHETQNVLPRRRRLRGTRRQVWFHRSVPCVLRMWLCPDVGFLLVHGQGEL